MEKESGKCHVKRRKAQREQERKGEKKKEKDSEPRGADHFSQEKRRAIFRKERKERAEGKAKTRKSAGRSDEGGPLPLNAEVGKRRGDARKREKIPMETGVSGRQLPRGKRGRKRGRLKKPKKERIRLGNGSIGSLQAQGTAGKRKAEEKKEFRRAAWRGN